MFYIVGFIVCWLALIAGVVCLITWLCSVSWQYIRASWFGQCYDAFMLWVKYYVIKTPVKKDLNFLREVRTDLIIGKYKSHLFTSFFIRFLNREIDKKIIDGLY